MARRYEKESCALESRLTSARERTAQLCEPLQLEDYVVQPIADVSPPKWHLAHTSWFFEQLILARYLGGYRAFDEHFGLLFNSYYKSVGTHWLQQERGALSRPTVEQVLSYREYVDTHLSELMRASGTDGGVQDLLQAGIHHEQQHQELLLMDIKYILGANPSMPRYTDQTYVLPMSTAGWRSIEAGIHAIGADKTGFAYDNERPRHRTWLDSCAIASRLVTNGEFREFLDDGGYREPHHWMSKGWEWAQSTGIRAPLYWFQRDGQWHEYTLAGPEALDADAPVMHVSWFEADAYARWSGHRLPSEQEYEIFQEREAPAPSLWCWTQSHYSPYPGFRPFDGALAEYNGKFMCNQFVLRGGSFATPAGHLRSSYRNFFEPHQRWMFSGIRLARG